MWPGMSEVRSEGRPLHCDPQLYPVVRRVNEILFRAEVALRRLHRSVAQQQLDLFEFPTGGPTKLRARPTIMPHAA